MVKNIIEMSKKNPKELYIKYKKKYLNLKNMIGGGSTYHFSIDGIDMQPIDQYDNTEGLQAALESKKLIKIGEGIYLDAIKSKVYVFEDGNTNEYDLEYASSAGGGLSASGGTYYYMKSGSKHVDLGDLSIYYKDFIHDEEQSYDLVPSIMRPPERGRPEGTIAIYRDDDTEAQTERTADLGRYKKEYDEKLSGSLGRQEQDSAPASPVSASLQRLSLPSVPASPQSALSELSRMPTGERKPTFHIYTTGLYSPSFASNFWVCFNIFMTENDWSGYDISIFHHITDREKLDEITMQFLRRYPTEIVRRLLTPEEIIGRPAQFKFLFDCSGMVYNHPLEGLVFDKEYFDTNRMQSPSGLEFDKHIELFQGIHCPSTDDPKNYVVNIKDGKVLTVYDKLVEFNNSSDISGVIDKQEKLKDFKYLPEIILDMVLLEIDKMNFNDEKNRQLMLDILKNLKKYIRYDFLNLLTEYLTEQKEIRKEDKFISIIIQIMLERLIINMVGQQLGIENPDSDEYFQSMILKYVDLIHSYKYTFEHIENLLSAIIKSETQHRL